MKGHDEMKRSLFRSPAELLEELQAPKLNAVVRDEDIPCIETSDKEKLCKAPLVSVQMLTYNHEKWIAEAIEGVVKQRTDFEFELIIGEDCSTDRTREICFEYQKKYPHIIRVLWSETNLRALNGRRCLIHARGKYQALCEGDDFWTDPLKLQKQVDLLRQANAVMCVAFNLIRHLDGREVVNAPAHKQFLDADDFLNGYFHTSTYVIRMDIYWRMRESFSDIREWYDTTTCFCMESMGKIVVLPEVVSTRRITGEGIATSLNAQQFAVLGLRQMLALYLYGPPKDRKQFGVEVMKRFCLLANSFCDGWSRDTFKRLTRGLVCQQIYVKIFPVWGATALLIKYWLFRFRFVHKIKNFVRGKTPPSAFRVGV